MSYNLFKPDRFLCEQELSSYAFGFQGPTVEFTDPAAADGIADNITIPGRYFLAKTVIALTRKPGLKVERVGEEAVETPAPAADFNISWIYGCPHRCVYCQQIYLCKNYPYMAIYPKIELVEDAIRRIAASWRGEQPFVCEVGRLTDIVALEHLTGWLSRLVLLFANEIAPHGQLYFLTKSGNFTPLLELNHRRATRVGIALVPDRQIRAMEPGAASLSARLILLARIIAAGYPIHISFSPILPVGDYEREYENFFEQVAKTLLQTGPSEMIDLTADVLLHYVKPECEAVVEELAPHVMGGMVSRRIGGHTRLTYPKKIFDAAVRHLRRMVPQYFPDARILSIS
jgi:DNA repair photolyase